jgi:hypothetical protein
VYGSADGVRLLHVKITTTLISDDDVEDIITGISDVEIDAELSGFGAPFAGTAPEIVSLISNLKTAASIYESRIATAGKPSEFAKLLRDQADSWLKKIKNGECSVTGITSPQLVSMLDGDEERPADEVFTGDETTWAARLEVRES